MGGQAVTGHRARSDAEESMRVPIGAAARGGPTRQRLGPSSGSGWAFGHGANTVDEECVDDEKGESLMGTSVEPGTERRGLASACGAYLLSVMASAWL